MEQIIVRDTEHSVCYNYNTLGIICYPASKKDFMKCWGKDKWYYGDTLAKMRKNRKEYLLEMVHCYAWFKNNYSPQLSDFEINVFKDFYQIHLMHYLLCDKLLVKAGGKHDPRFGNFATVIKEVSFIWDITKTIVEYYNIEWIKFSDDLVLTNY